MRGSSPAPDPAADSEADAERGVPRPRHRQAEFGERVSGGTHQSKAGRHPPQRARLPGRPADAGAPDASHEAHSELVAPETERGLSPNVGVLDDPAARAARSRERIAECERVRSCRLRPEGAGSEAG